MKPEKNANLYQRLGKGLKTMAVAGDLTGMLLLSGCDDDARMASKNISKVADNFEIPRLIVFYNGLTDNYIMTVEGLCAVESDNVDNQLEITFKTEEGIKKSTLESLMIPLILFSN